MVPPLRPVWPLCGHVYVYQTFDVETKVPLSAYEKGMPQQSGAVRLASVGRNRGSPTRGTIKKKILFFSPAFPGCLLRLPPRVKKSLHHYKNGIVRGQPHTTARHSNSLTMSILPSIIRAPVDNHRKQWLKTRALVNQTLQEKFSNDARRVEHSIYMMSHASMEQYIEMVFISLMHVDTLRQTTPEVFLNSYYQSLKGMASASSPSVGSSDLRAMFKPRQVVSISDRYALSRCSKCHGTDINVEAKQIRSADEGMSVVCKCNTCFYSWTVR